MGQAIWRLVQWRAGKVRNEHLRATRDDVRALRTKLSLALSGGEVFRGDGERQWVQGVDDALRAIENHIGTAIGGRYAPKT